MKSTFEALMIFTSGSTPARVSKQDAEQCLEGCNTFLNWKWSCKIPYKFSSATLRTNDLERFC